MKNRHLLFAAVCGVFVSLFATSVNASTVLPYNGSALRLWLQADEGLTLDPGPANINRVIGWADTVGFGGNVVSEDGVGPSGNRPLFVNNVLNGLGVVRFNAGDRRINGPAALTAGGGDKTIIMLVSTASAPGNQIVFDPNGQGATPNGAVIRITPELNVRYGNGLTAATGGPLTSAFEVIAVQTGATHAETAIFRDGLLATGASNNPGNPINTGTAGYNIGGINAGTDWEGDMAELLVFEERLTLTQLNAIGLYLQNKYALSTNFPVPEPATATLALLGFASMTMRRRRAA